MGPPRLGFPLGALHSLANLALTTLLIISLMSGTSTAHMELTNPPPLRSKANQHTTDPDYGMTTPLSSSGTNFPCKGFLSLLDTSQATAVTTYTSGQSYKMTISGGAPHNGGSCQASLSLDSGKTFHVIHSYIGGCPGLGTSSDFDFTIPGDVPSTKGAIFSWTWFNYLGNREMYQNCAVVDIVAGERGNHGEEMISFASRPEMFAANIGNGCGTVEAKSLRFPNPGPDVDVNDGGAVGPIGGGCQVAVVSGGGSGGETGQGGGGGGGGAQDDGGPLGQSGPLPSPGPGTWTPGNTWPAGFPSSAEQGYFTLHFSMSTYVYAFFVGFILGWVRWDV